MVLCKKTGYEIDIQLNDVQVTIVEGKTHIHLDMDAEIDKEELLKNIG
jgi:hypothetical protein